MILFRKGINGRNFSDIAQAYCKKLLESKEDYSPKLLISKALTGDEALKQFANWLLKDDCKELIGLILLHPSEMTAFNERITKKNPNLEFNGKPIRDAIKTWFSYGHLNDLIGRNWLVEQLDISVCPYCNIRDLPHISYLKVQNRKNPIYLLDFDHFYPKAWFPWFSLSFYNLVPSCLPCNQRLKGQRKATFEKYVHPFAEAFHDYQRFETVPDIRFPSFKRKAIQLVGKNLGKNCKEKNLGKNCKGKRTSELFALEDQYKPYLHEAEVLAEDFHEWKSCQRRDRTLLKIKGKVEGEFEEIKIEEIDLQQIIRRHNIPESIPEIGKIRLGKLKYDLWDDLIERNERSIFD